MKRLLTMIVAVTAISGSGATFPTDDRAIVHVLGRTAFGPRPGDVERVRTMGIQRYIDEQLHPVGFVALVHIGRLVLEIQVVLEASAAATNDPQAQTLAF